MSKPKKAKMGAAQTTMDGWETGEWKEKDNEEETEEEK